MTPVPAWQLRARFAERLSHLYAQEVPAYLSLVSASHEVNQRVLEAEGDDAERLGSIERVTAERHGAIRVGTPTEMAQAAQVFAALGMHPVGFYDLRDAAPHPVPVVSTAFRPVDEQELARNPFRVFTSMLVPEDRRFFDADLEQRLTSFLAGRVLFGPELLELARQAEADAGLPAEDADRFLELAADCFRLSTEPIDRAWYEELSRVSGVAADIGGVRSTHINHLTPRVLDIDDLYRTMTERGIEMIDAIQGPPRWEGPDVLLRQTSFRALAEPRRFREADGTIGRGDLRVRFGEVEARGLALTPAGREIYDELMASGAAAAWEDRLPTTERGIAEQELAFFTYRPCPQPPEGTPPSTVPELLAGGWVTAEPIVYEDFLPRSAAGIFASNLTGAGEVDAVSAGADRTIDWLSGAIDREVRPPEQLYAAQSDASLERALAALHR